MTLTFDGRVAVITGAGGGLGRTYALELARRGARIVVNDLGGAPDGTGGSASAADAVVDEIVAAGGEAVASYDSVATPQGGAAIVDRAIAAFGTVDIVINNAGNLRDRSFLKLSPEDIRSVMDVHLFGAFHVTQPAFAVMKEQGYGRLLFTTSAAGLWGNFGQANYAAAKLALVGLSNVLAIEGHRSNIRSNVIAPVAASRLTDGILDESLAAHLQPELVTPLAVYLVSDACELTHEVFSVGGGRYARVFLGLGPGWFATGTPSVEEVAEHLGEIRAIERFVEPRSVDDEVSLVTAAATEGMS